MSYIHLGKDCLLCDVPLRSSEQFLCGDCELRKKPYQQAIRRLLARYNRLFTGKHRQFITIEEHERTIKELREKVASLDQALANSRKSDHDQEGKASDIDDQEGQDERPSHEANGIERQDLAENVSSDEQNVPLQELEQAAISVVSDMETGKVLSDEQSVPLQELKQAAASVVSDMETAFHAAQAAVAKANAKHEAVLKVLIGSIADVGSTKKKMEEAFSTLFIDQATKGNEGSAAPEST